MAEMQQQANPEISLSQIPMQESEVVLNNQGHIRSAPLVTESQQTDAELGISVTEMRAQANQAMIRRVRFSDGQTGLGNSATQFIVRETDEETENEEVLDEKEIQKKKAEEDRLYFFGYFSWYWGKHGFWKATKDFFGMQILNGVVFSFFNSIGAAVGAFFFKKWFLKGSFLGSYC